MQDSKLGPQDLSLTFCCCLITKLVGVVIEVLLQLLLKKEHSNEKSFTSVTSKETCVPISHVVNVLLLLNALNPISIVFELNSILGTVNLPSLLLRLQKRLYLEES